MPRLDDPLAGAGGLSSSEAARRLVADGRNSLPPPRRASAARRLLAELTHFFALMLWVAAALSIVAGMPELGAAIAVVIGVNGVFAFAQEHRAERAAERLRDLLPAAVRVVRDGTQATVHADEVVRGDVVLLEAGDRVPADLVLDDAEDLRVDESMLTGESVPVPCGAGTDVPGGSFVVSGDGRGTVVATGARTRIAEIARLTAGVHRRPSPLAAEVHRVVRTVAVMAIGLGSAFFVLALLLGTPAVDGFVFAVGVTVALVPEGLLPTVTLSLAMGAQRMAERHALVRRLEAVETLGSTTFICTDKTGTLTRNQMSVVEVWTPSGSVHLAGEGYAPTAAIVADDGDAVAAAGAAAAAARSCSSGEVVLREGGWVAVGDPMEAAIDALARRLDCPPGNADVRRHWTFDPARRRESVLSGGRILTKGAPDAVLGRCAAGAAAAEAVEALAARGLRVLAVASRGSCEGDVGASADEVERDLELLGLLAFEDPPREGVAASLESCRRAGIRVAMLTGDHPATARAIAAEIGLLGPDGLVLRGDELPEDDQVLGALLDRDGVVLSRVDPEQKLRVARVLQARGHVVAMTGDGVNDAPALRAADIGVAMGRSGTDVAREAADLVLLDDDFSTIVGAVEQGRATFANIRRFLTYHLTDNVAELTPFLVWALSGGRFPLALGVLQILCIDIGTDLVPALALGGEAPAPHVLERPPERRHLIDGALLRRVFGVLGPVEALAEMTAFVTALALAGWRPGEGFPTGHALAAASGAAFATVMAGQAANAFACRSASRPPWRLGWTSNPLLLVASAVTVGLASLFLG
ncbi:MAG TPA: cation-transporting P-type ATPase, partial [Acidimicrobiales bacterium]|nr:cation-transporting P-type ATPase [Acidimicrobiales bacterium]